MDLKRQGHLESRVVYSTHFNTSIFKTFYPEYPFIKYINIFKDMQPYITISLLIVSNIFMNFAWYGHLKNKAMPLYYAILMSWGIAFFEYLLTVPANRIGSGVFSLFQLKIIQEILTIIVFVAMSVLYFEEKLRWNYIAGFACIILAAFFVFYDWK